VSHKSSLCTESVGNIPEEVVRAALAEVEEVTRIVVSDAEEVS
jgi:hypothetical protein